MSRNKKQLLFLLAFIATLRTGSVTCCPTLLFFFQRTFAVNENRWFRNVRCGPIQITGFWFAAFHSIISLCDSVMSCSSKLRRASVKSENRLFTPWL